MNSSTNSPADGRDALPNDKEAEVKDRKTPNTDMQPEDAGTADSGNEPRHDKQIDERAAQGRAKRNESKQ